MKRNTILLSATVLAVGVAAAAAAAMRRGRKPTPENVLDICLQAADELEMRIRSAVRDTCGTSVGV